MRHHLAIVLACALAGAGLVGVVADAQEIRVKPAIRGLVSMGAYKFVGYGGEPVNTLDPLNAKPGIFGGLVVVASWAHLQPEPNSTIANGNVIDKAMAEVRAYNASAPGQAVVGPTANLGGRVQQNALVVRTALCVEAHEAILDGGVGL